MEQLEIFEAIDRKVEYHVEDGMEDHTHKKGNLNPNVAIACGSCGSHMKCMGSQRKKEVELDIDGEIEYFIVGKWMYSCRVCNGGSSSVYVNPKILLYNTNMSQLKSERDSFDTDNITFTDEMGSGHVLIGSDKFKNVKHENKIFTYYPGKYNKDEYPMED